MRRPELAIVGSVLALFAGGRAEARERVAASREPSPAWVRSAPPPDGQFYYFVGFTSDLATLDDAREQAIKKAMAGIVDYFGQEGRSKFVSTETETENGHRYNVTLQIQFEGQKITLRGIQLTDWYYEEFRDGGRRSFDFHALIRYPRGEYQAVLAELAERRRQELARAQERVSLAVARYDLGRQRARESRHLEAVTLFDEASAILASLGGVLPVSHVEAHNTTLLAEEIARARAKAATGREARYRTITARASCSQDGVDYHCPSVEHAQLELASSVGFRGLDAATTTVAATFEVKLRIEVISSGAVGDVHYARARGSFSVVESKTGQVMSSGETPSQKAGQLTPDRASKLAAIAAEKQLSIEVRKALRKL